MRRLILACFLSLFCWANHIFAQPEVDSLSRVSIRVAQSHYSVNELFHKSKQLRSERPASALHYAQIAYEAADSLNLLSKKAEIALHISEVYESYGEYTQALQYTQNCVKIYKAQADARKLLRVYKTLANLYAKAENSFQANRHIKKALELSQRINHPQILIDLYLKIVDIKIRLKEYKSAIEYASGTLVGFKSISPTDEVHFRHSLSYVYNRVEDYKQGLKFALQTQELLANHPSPDTLVLCLYEIALARQGLGEIKEARKVYEKALEIAHKRRFKPQVALIYQQLSKISEKEGNITQALRMFQSYQIYQEAVNKEKQQKELAKFEVWVELREKNQEIALLTKDKALRDKEIHYQYLVIYAFLVTIVVLFSLAYLFFRYYRNTKKINNLLVLQNDEIKEKQVAILDQQKKIEKKNRMLELQNYEIVIQSNALESINQDLTDSLEYARRIQNAMLPSPHLLNPVLPDHFIFFKPKDIVSGDFYWFQDRPDLFIIAVVDCTGHGVPGAFMSLIGNDLLNDIIKTRHITEPEEILSELHKGVRHALNQDSNDNKDGMDLAICAIDKQNDVIKFAGAYNPVVIIQDRELKSIRGDSNPIGGWHSSGSSRTFNQHQIPIDSETLFYLYSDGYQDQFGGPNGRKLMKSRFRKILHSIHRKPMPEQKKILEDTITLWMEGHPQIDDILIFGARLTPGQFQENSSR